MNKQYDWQEILNNFKMEKPKKTVWGNYRIIENKLLYVTTETIELRNCLSMAELKRWIKENGVNSKKLTLHGFDIDLKEAARRIKAANYGLEFHGKKTVRDEIARKVRASAGNYVGEETMLLGNSSILPLVGRTVAYGHVSENRRVTEIQRTMESDGEFKMIPFNVFEEAGLNLDNFLQVDKGEPETVTVKVEYEEWNREKQRHEKKHKEESRHFTGASLFTVDGQTYLFDIDRREIKHGIFNAFLAACPGNPGSIEKAYESLKPKAVVEAEKKNKKVLRQGEWFFIPTRAPKIRKLTQEQKILTLLEDSSWRFSDRARALGLDPDKLAKKAQMFRDAIPERGQLRAGNSRPNTVTQYMKVGAKVYCSGTVSHTGREHADLKLDGWYEAIPNTSINNFTVTGDVD